MNFANDIPRDLAHAAHAGTSFVPDKRAEQERANHAAALQADYEQLSKLADTDDKRAQLAEEFERYREGYRKRKVALLQSRARCMSTMITGRSNFPVERQRKRSAIADRRCQELLDFRERALAAIRKALCPELRPIMSGDSDATDRLRQKIAEAEKLQETG